MRTFVKIGKPPSGHEPEKFIDLDEIAAFTETFLLLKTGQRFTSDPHIYKCLVELIQDNPVEDTQVIELHCVAFSGYEVKCRYNNGRLCPSKVLLNEIQQ